MKQTYTKAATQDLIRLRNFIAKNNQPVANRIANELVNKINLLKDFPKIGTPVSLASDSNDLRDMVFGKYVVRYLIAASEIKILRIWHGLESR